jgi:hypothetical protein
VSEASVRFTMEHNEIRRAVLPAAVRVSATADENRYGLSWSKVKSGHIISANEDETVAHW